MLFLRVTLIVSISIPVLIGTVFNARADAGITDLWQRYLKNCGSLMISKEAMFADFPIKEAGHVLGVSEAGTRLAYGWASSDYSESGAVEVSFGPDVMSVSCTVGISPSQANIDPVSEAVKLKEHIATNERLSFDGGQMLHLSDNPQMVQNFTGGGVALSFNVYGAFEDPQIISIVDIKKTYVTIFNMYVTKID
ncbi:hypothetical protein [Roseibium marinum]|uniref:Uncharacterized protein n=1 Tax=Roseibium marinum TaxID=281252 RepID=A0A2S3UJP9_9HYPH|nr:hypothetical protein [Roseibium marinum]POF27936.1 hypothetical protein CLV41_11917 [Roseibium marinum]